MKGWSLYDNNKTQVLLSIGGVCFIALQEKAYRRRIQYMEPIPYHHVIKQTNNSGREFVFS